jgi:4-alpha-glucanotransferase
LAEAHGVAATYLDFQERERAVAPATLRAVLAALDVPAADGGQVAASLRRTWEVPWRRIVAPTVTSRQSQPTTVRLTVPDGGRASLALHLDSDPALGGTGGRLDLGVAEPPTAHATRVIDGRIYNRVDFALPAGLPLGWHRLEVTVEPGGQCAQAVLVVAPDRADWPAQLLDRRAWGVMAQLYSVRSAASWGVGDFEDLAALAAGMAQEGADFLLVNPLHAAELTGPMTPSPYLPTSRAFLNPLYIRPEALPEYQAAPPAVRDRVDALARRVRAGNEDAAVGALDRDRAWAAKRAALELLFAEGTTPERARDLADYRAARGQELDDFALWNVLQELAAAARRPAGDVQPGSAVTPPDFTPTDVRPGTPQAAQVAQAHAGRITFHCWLQWAAELQLEAAQARARAAGMRIGLAGDLAVGSHPAGEDIWAAPDVYAAGVQVGAPPDLFNQQGPCWSEPPLRPDALERTGYAAYKAMLRAVLRPLGALRADHILGLFRLWWIPDGFGPADGAYVAYDHEAMISILALEAHRAGAVIIGEDLGVVPPGTRAALAERAIGGNSITWFEPAGADGRPPAPAAYRRLCLTTITTHDLPPTGAYLRGEHIRQRLAHGLLKTGAAEAWAGALDERARWARRLCELGYLDPAVAGRVATATFAVQGEPDVGGPAALGGTAERLAGSASSTDQVSGTAGPASDADLAEMVRALHRYLLATPSAMVGVALADLVGERRTQNLPGTDREYPNWSVPLADAAGRPVLLEDIAASPVFRDLIAAIRAAAGS